MQAIRRTLKQGLKIDFIGLGLLGVGLGFLQIVLDKGQRDDWFGSPFIVWGTVIAVTSLIVLVFRELSIATRSSICICSRIGISRFPHS